MAKRTAKPRSGFDAGEEKTLRHLVELFKEARFEIQERFALHRDGMPDLEVGRNDLWTHRTYAIELALVEDARQLYEKLEQLQAYASSLKRGTYDEYWLVSNLSFPEKGRGHFKSRLPTKLRALTIKEVERMLLRQVPPKPSRPPGSRAKTKVGKAVLAKKQEIQLQIGAIILQIEMKLETLRDQRPNDPDTQTKLTQEISDYERMKSELQDIREKVAAFVSKKLSEKEVVKSVATFGSSVKQMWEKHHESVLATAGKAALFVSSVGLLSTMNWNTDVAVAVAGAVIEPRILGGLKKMKKKVFG